eukprot:gene35327-42807_t
MTDSVMIKKARPLTRADLLKLPNSIAMKLHVNASDYDDNDLLESDFVQWEVAIGETMYRVFHGFPGDVPIGVFVDDAGESVLATFGEGGCAAMDKDDENVDTFLAWYDEVTENACNFEKEEFRASLLGDKRNNEEVEESSEQPSAKKPKVSSEDVDGKDD